MLAWVYMNNYLYILIVFMLQESPEISDVSVVIHPELERFREEITSIDREIVNLLHERSLKIAEWKDPNDTDKQNLQREYITNLQKWGKNQWLNIEFIESIWEALFQWIPGIYDIDLDVPLIQLLHQRFQVVEKVGIFKESIGMPPMQEEQWRKVVKTRREWARGLWFDSIWMKRFLNTIHDYSLKIEERCKSSNFHIPVCGCVGCQVPAQIGEILK